MNTPQSLLQNQELPQLGQSGIASLLTRQCKANAERVALVFASERQSYGQLKARALCVARQLLSLGVGTGDKVALLFPNHPDYVAAFFAVVGLGAVVIPINPLLKSEEIAHILSDSNSKVIIVEAKALSQVYSAAQKVSELKHVLVAAADKCISLPEPATAVNFQFLDINEAQTLDLDWPRAVNSMSDLAVLVYTSGTTGKPKGAMLSHGNLLFAVDSAFHAFEVSAGDRCLAVLPLCHIYGLAVVMLGIFAHGGALVIEEKFEPQAVLRLIEKEQVTLLPAVPAMYQFMLMDLEARKYNLESVRLCISGASALPVDLISRIESAFGAPVLEGYALTEVSCVASINPLHGKRKPGSVGLAFPGVELGIFNTEGKLLSYGAEQVGEVAVKGPNVMRGYYQQAEATAECLKQGWFLTGDLGYADENGYLYIVGRKKEMIIRGGQNIYPREIEEVIRRLEGVADVAVIGIPDQYMGERVKAFVVCKSEGILSADEIKAFCVEHLAEYKVPRLVEFVDALPRNSTGKVLKRLLC